jgi:hypothetical protein
MTGAVLPATGLFFVVPGLLQARAYGFGPPGPTSRSAARW